MRSPLRHYPWDGGLHEVMRGILERKTVKTYCQKRVPTSDRVTTEGVTCPDCISEIQRESLTLKTLRGKIAPDTLDRAQAALDRALGVEP